METILDEDVWADIGLLACLMRYKPRIDHRSMMANEWSFMEELHHLFKTCRDPVWSWIDQWIDHNDHAASLLLSGPG